MGTNPAKMKNIRDNFDRVFWKGVEYRSSDYKGKTDDRANALAVVAGLFLDSCRQAALR